MGLPYTSPSEAYDCAQERLGNPVLQAEVTEFLGGIWPEGFEDIGQPQAVFAPYMARGSERELLFLDLANKTGFQPVVATYLEAEFVTNNPELVDCYRPPLKLPKDQRSRNWLVDSSNRPGTIGEATTIFGTNIFDFWKSIREAVLRDKNLPPPTTVDFSTWYGTQAQRFGWQGERSKSPFYYNALMGLYTSGRAVLFDTPPTEFASRVMEPAATASEEALGLPPLITCELDSSKRDWVDVSFLGDNACRQLIQTGTIGDGL